jgi:hypothetical protein
LVDGAADRPSGFDIEDAENGQAMRANASRVTPAAGYTSVGGQIFDQLAQAFGEDSGPVAYGDKYAKDAKDAWMSCLHSATYPSIGVQANLRSHTAPGLIATQSRHSSEAR